MTCQVAPILVGFSDDCVFIDRNGGIVPSFSQFLFIEEIVPTYRTGRHDAGDIPKDVPITIGVTVRHACP